MEPHAASADETASTAHDFDVIVIGGGPAGSTAAALIARGGYRVLQLERDSFPRFKIGESLIPSTYDIFARLGLVEPMQQSIFTKKYSVQFISGQGKASAPFYFWENDPSERSQTWQVRRSEFDLMLLDHARNQGVTVWQNTGVKEVLFAGERAVGVLAQLADGSTRSIRSQVVIDASGQRALLARQLQLIQSDPHLKMAAIFTHFAGAYRDPGMDAGATLVAHTQNKDSWFWYIPLHDDRVSVGVVGRVESLIRGRQGDPQQIFDQELAICPGIAPRLRHARQVEEIRVLKEFSYMSRQLAGDGWILIGDAFGFLDPIYSTGVLLALRSAEFAADAVLAGLAAGNTSGAHLSRHEARLRAAMRSFYLLVYSFYEKEFSFSRFLQVYPEQRQAIIDILVGDVFDRDFTPLFDAIGRMIRLPDRAPVPTAV